MKQVDVYEVSKTRRVLEGAYDQIPIHELRLDGGRAWGNPGGGDTFVRYDLPVTRIVENRVEGGFTHRKESYVAIGPRLLELIGPAVNDGLTRLNTAKSREIEDLLISQKTHLTAISRHVDAKARAESNAMLQAEVAQHMSDRIWNFRQANVLTRIWRAIRLAI